MSEFSFLNYLDQFTGSALTEVKAASGMTVEDLSEFTGFSHDTIKGWFKSEDSPRRKIPARYSWNLVMYMLEARRLGYESLDELIKSTPPKNN